MRAFQSLVRPFLRILFLRLLSSFFERERELIREVCAPSPQLTRAACNTRDLSHVSHRIITPTSGDSVAKPTRTKRFESLNLIDIVDNSADTTLNCVCSWWLYLKKEKLCANIYACGDCILWLFLVVFASMCSIKP